MEVGVVGVEYRADGADDDLLFVEGGDEHGDAGIESGRGEGVGSAHAVDDREDANQQQAGAHKDVANEEDQNDEFADESRVEKAMESGRARRNC